MTDHQTLTAFLTAWQLQDWSAMAALTQITWRSKQSDPAAWLRQLYELKRLESFEILPYKPISAAASRIPVVVKYRVAGGKGFGKPPLRTVQLKAMVICESAPYQPTPNATWGVNPISTLREGTKRSNRTAKNQVVKQL